MPALPSFSHPTIGRFAILLLIASLAGCSFFHKLFTPPQAERDSDHLDALAVRIAAHENLAAQQQASGELSAASAHLRVLTLLAPEQERYRIQLESLGLHIDRTVAEKLATGRAAHRRGDLDAASAALLEALALNPEEMEAQQILREIERQRIATKQADRAARIKVPAANAALAKQEKASEDPKISAQAYELEQTLELFGAGDTERGLREMQRYAKSYPNDRAGRERLSSTVFSRATELVAQGKREPGLTMMERAVTLRGSPLPLWTAQLQTTRKALGSEYYDQAWRAYRTNIPQAIKLWETSLRFDPQNANSALKLQEAKRIQESLRRIEKK